MTFGEDAATNRTGSGPAKLATIRAAIAAAIKDVGYLHVPEGRRDHTTRPKPSASPVLIRTDADNHGTRRSPGVAARKADDQPFERLPSAAGGAVQPGRTRPDSYAMTTS